MKKLLVLLFIIPMLLLIFANVVNSAPPAEPGVLVSMPPLKTLPPLPTVIPVPSSLMLDIIVDIPDANLRAKLHAKTGVPNAQALYQSDLAALTGTLTLDNCGIANTEGVQYCKNIQTLKLNNNSLTTLPDSLFTMTNLKVLDVSNNKIKSISSSVSGLTGLTQLYLSNNKLESLPDSICKLTSLHTLEVSYNSLYDLPKDIGDHLSVLTAYFNRLTSIPKSVLESTSLYGLNLRLNRLSSLPSNFDDKEFDYFVVDFNFLDVSPGSPARELIEDNPTASDDKFYKQQLTPVKDLTAFPATDSVTLSWSPCPDGSHGTATWEVDGYVVYEYKNGEMVKISDVDKSETGFVHTGLAPETAFDYRVGVDYHVVDPSHGNDVTTRCYTKVQTATLASTAPAAVSPEGAPEVSSPESPEESSGVLPAGGGTDITPPAEDAALPIWAIIIICASVAGIAGTVTALVILNARKPKP